MSKLFGKGFTKESDQSKSGQKEKERCISAGSWFGFLITRVNDVKTKSSNENDLESLCSQAISTKDKCDTEMKTYRNCICVIVVSGSFQIVFSTSLSLS